MLNPCARETKARTGRFLTEKLISNHGLFSSYKWANKARRTGKIRGVFFRDALLMHRRQREVKSLERDDIKNVLVSY